jgi:uncharacterized protein (TIGR02466 family)
MPHMIEDVSVRDLFPTPIWSVDFKPDYAAALNARLLQDIDALMSPRPPLAPGANWQTDPMIHRLPQFGELVALVEKAARGAADFLKLKARDLEVTGCWANVNPPGGRNSSHTHPNNFLSGVYYVATPASEGRIVFEDPRPQAYVMMPPVAEFTPYNGNNITFDVKPGRLVLFPAWLTHSVPVNRSNQDRVSIAFNLMFKNYVDEASPALWRGTVKVPAT